MEGFTSTSLLLVHTSEIPADKGLTVANCCQ